MKDDVAEIRPAGAAAGATAEVTAEAAAEAAAEEPELTAAPSNSAQCPVTMIISRTPACFAVFTHRRMAGTPSTGSRGLKTPILSEYPAASMTISILIPRVSLIVIVFPLILC